MSLLQDSGDSSPGVPGVLPLRLERASRYSLLSATVGSMRVARVAGR